MASKIKTEFSPRPRRPEAGQPRGAGVVDTSRDLDRITHGSVELRNQLIQVAGDMAYEMGIV